MKHSSLTSLQDSTPCDAGLEEHSEGKEPRAKVRAAVAVRSLSTLEQFYANVASVSSPGRGSATLFWTVLT